MDKKTTVLLVDDEPMFDPYYTPINWSPVAHTAYYGASIRSALLTRSGVGSSVASWTTVLPSAGFYDVYVFIPKSAMLGSPGKGRSRGSGGSSRSSGNQSGGGRSMGPPFADERTIYNYTISSNEGTEEVEFRLRNTEEGWNKVGAFHFTADTARIDLSNSTNGKRVFADAVKWVQR